MPKEYQGADKSNKIRLSLVYNLHGVLVMTQAQLMEELPPAPAPEEKAEDKEKAADETTEGKWLFFQREEG